MLMTETDAALEAKRSQLRTELARIDFELSRRNRDRSQRMQQERGLWLAEQALMLRRNKVLAGFD